MLVKVNMVVKCGINDSEILLMVEWFCGIGVILCFIEYMDVGMLNGWNMIEVLLLVDVVVCIVEYFLLVLFELYIVVEIV